MDLIFSKHSLQYSYLVAVGLWLATLAGLIGYRRNAALGFLFVSVVIFWIFHHTDGIVIYGRFAGTKILAGSCS